MRAALALVFLLGLPPLTGGAQEAAQRESQPGTERPPQVRAISDGVPDSMPTPGQFEKASARFRAGKYAEVAREAGEAGMPDEGWPLLHIESLMATGRYATWKKGIATGTTTPATR